MGMKNTMTGNRVLLKLKGNVVGGGFQDVSMQDSAGLQDVDGLGELEVQELVPGKLVHTINLSSYFVSGKNLKQLGYVPSADTILTIPDFEVEIQDKLSGETVELYTGCRFDSHSRTYNKNAICGENATVRALHKEK